MSFALKIILEFIAVVKNKQTLNYFFRGALKEKNTAPSSAFLKQGAHHVSIMYEPSCRVGNQAIIYYFTGIFCLQA